MASAFLSVRGAAMRVTAPALPWASMARRSRYGSAVTGLTYKRC